MTKRQSELLHAALRETETQWNPESGLPICTQEQIEQRRSIIAEFERKRRHKKMGV